MPDLYPEIEPFAQGMLEVTGGDLVYWEVCGNPRGKPAVVLHGGPGSGCAPWHRRLFDPAAYRVVLFDQRGCGRSRPHASSPETELSGNTTGNLIADMELLRGHLDVERWLVLGGSWGSALALAYAERFPTRVTELILFGVTTGRREEIPGVLVNGRFDLQTPIATAWTLHSLWPRSELVVVNDAGHAASNPGITEELIRATDRFARG
jgi:proline iminopeptidase